jgi:DNA (cytosine-5)-methyltransferase 1
MVWENVPGAFSSNKAEDFRIVLEEIAKVCEENAVIPMPPNGKWTTCGCIVGNGWSVAWRVFDAQFWGVPQRRRRIALVADFGGQSAPEILFVRESVSGHLDESGTQREEIAADAERGVGADDSKTTAKLMDAYQHHGWRESDTVGTLTTGQNNTVRGDTPLVCYGISSYDSNAMKSNNPNSGIYVADTARTLDLNGGNPACHQGGIAIVENYPYQEKCGALCARDYNGVGSQYVDEDKLVVCVDQGGGKSACKVTEGQAPTLTCTHDGTPEVCYEQPKARHIVRRLTPLECERLQGYPDGWTDIGEWTDSKGKVHKASDAARYKALGNSIALPPWKWVLKRLCACYERDATMASLFDGIGGFPYLWEQLNGKGSCLWASEIEEFPMAVTKVRIGE